MKQIPLTQGLVALVDDEDYGRVVAAGKWSTLRVGNLTYAVRQVLRADGKRRPLLMHTFLTGYPLTDHANHDGLDNRRSNLREATHGENLHNARLRSDNTSGFKGVSWSKRDRNWYTRIRIDGRQRRIGAFTTAEEAARAYDAEARRLFGEFACVNFPLVGERAA